MKDRTKPPQRLHLSIQTGAVVMALAIAGAVLNANAQVRLEQNGRVLVQAEHFFANTPNANGDHWHLWPNEENYPTDFVITAHQNAWGSQAMYMLPDNGGSNHTGGTGAANGWDDKPWLDFKVRIATTGTYQLWLRWRGRDGSSDSMYAQILELKNGTSDWYNYFGNSGVGFNGQWRGTAVPQVTSASGTAVNATWNITTPGDYTIRLTYREDGCAVDAICLQLESMGAPTDTVIAESQLLEATPFIWSRTPAAGARNVLPTTPYRVQIRDGSSTALSAVNPTFLLNGTPLSFTLTKANQITTLDAAAAGALPLGSTNELQVQYQDTASVNYTSTWQFVVSTPLTIPTSLKMAAGEVNTAEPGFIANLHQAVTYDTNTSTVVYNITFPNSEDRAEGQLRGYYTDPATGLPYTNNIGPAGGLAPAPFAWGDGTDENSLPETWVNFNITPSYLAGTDIGNFQIDPNDPNFGTLDITLPGYSTRQDQGNTYNIAAEFITYLDLPAGVTKLGVNSDDGFIVSCGRNPRERYDSNKVLVLGRFDGGRGAADTTFDVQVDEAGIYPIRLLWYQGNGGANLEFFSFKPDGTKVLINNIASGSRPGDPTSLRAYRTANVQLSAVVDLLEPTPNARNVATNASLRVQLGDSANATVNQNSIHLYLKDVEVTPVKTASAPRTLLAYTPVAAFAEDSTNTARVEFTDSLGNSITQAWTFVVPAATAAPAQGEVLRKIWNNIYEPPDGTGTATLDQFLVHPAFTNNMDYNTNGQPTVITAALEQAQFANPTYDHYGQQWIGYLKPEVSDFYTFYLGSDDASRLSLSTNELAVGLREIARQNDYNSFREYVLGRNIYARRSAQIYLEAGKRYLFEAVHKEGTGGDNFSVAWRRPTDPAISDGYASIPGKFLEKFVGADFKIQPLSVTTGKGRAVTLSARVLLGLGSPSYQWLKDGQPKSGATGLTLVIDPAQPGDSGTYKLRVTLSGVTYDSAEAVVTVNDDTTPPAVVSAIGMNDPVLAGAGGPGYTVAVQFNETISPASVNAATITLSDAGNSIVEKGVGGSQNEVLLIKTTAALQANFSVTLSGITDMAGNSLPASTAVPCTLSPHTPMVLGTPGTDPVDTSGTVAYGLGADGFLVVANGSDIWNNADAGHFIYKTFQGDFDAKVRVESLFMANTWSKAGIMARENLTPGSRNTMILVSPTAGQNVYNMQWRDVADAGCGSKDAAERIYGIPYPNAWVRLMRQGDTFTAFISTNNAVDWLQYQQHTFSPSMPQELYVGLATTSHDNIAADLTTAVYRDYQIAAYNPITTPQITAVGPLPDGNVTLSFTASVGQAYRVLAGTSLTVPRAQWTVISQGTVSANPVVVDDRNATNNAARFYTIVSP